MLGALPEEACIKYRKNLA